MGPLDHLGVASLGVYGDDAFLFLGIDLSLSSPCWIQLEVRHLELFSWARTYFLPMVKSLSYICELALKQH